MFPPGNYSVNPSGVLEDGRRPQIDFEASTEPIDIGSGAVEGELPYVEMNAVEAQNTRMFLDSMGMNVVGNLIISMILFVLFWPLVPLPVIIAWAVPTAIVTIWRATLRRRIQRLSHEDMELIRWRNLAIVGSALGGGTIGLGAFLFTPFANTPLLMLLALVVAGASIAALPGTVSVMKAFVWFLSTSMGQMVAAFLMLGTNMSLAVVAMSPFFFVFILVAGHRQNRVITRSFEIALENDALVKRLALEKGISQNVNRQPDAETTERERLDELHNAIITGTAPLTGGNYLRGLIRHLAVVLNTRYALIAEITNSRRERVRTVALCVDGEYAENIEYELRGTPCENVIEQGLCVYPSGVQQRFPAVPLLVQMGVESYVGMPLFDHDRGVIGLIVVLDDRPLNHTKFLKKLFSVLAARAAAELARAQTDAALMESESRYRALYHDTPAMFLTLSNQAVIHSVNRFGAQKLGYNVEKLINQPASILYRAGESRALHEHIRDCLANSSEVHHRETTMLCKDGALIWVRETARVVQGSGSDPMVLMVCEDLTAVRRLMQRLSFQSRHDELTGLPNRREFEINLVRALDAAYTEFAEHALCYLDLDQFKVINDTCGHAAGDELLRQLAQVLKGQVRKSDSLARLGGDKFGVLMEGCSVKQAWKVAETIRRSVEEFRFEWEGTTWRIGVSVGLVPVTRESESLAKVLRAADTACYIAKEQGRNRVYVCYGNDEEIQRRNGEIQWLGRIHRALDENGFVLHYQPIVRVDSAEEFGINHCELLVRMQDDDGNCHPHADFLTAAEKFSLVTRIDRWVLQATLDWLKNNSRHFVDLPVCSINISGQSIDDEDFLAHVKKCFETSAVPPSKICFEITETAAIANLPRASIFVTKLKALGSLFALDDFGSGLSSFAYLKSLPVDFLKIDGQYIRTIVDDLTNRAIVTSMHQMARATGKQTIAEFVENDEILACLRDIGVDYAQGYAVGRPRPLATLCDERGEERELPSRRAVSRD